VLAADPETGVRAAVAGNRAAPAALLHKLAADTLETVRAQVARNGATPASVLATLAGDREASIRRLAAAHRNTDGQTLATLTRDADADTRLAAASNPSTPLATLLSLLDSQETALRSAANANPSMSSEALVGQIRAGRIVSSELLTRLSAHKSDAVRAAVALRAETPAAVLERMARNERANMIHCAIALNPSLTSEIASILINGPGRINDWIFPAGKATSPDQDAANVLAALAKNPNRQIQQLALSTLRQWQTAYCRSACTASCIVCTGCTTVCTGCTGCTGCVHCTSGCTACTVCTIGT
jgi:hypothetical protein